MQELELVDESLAVEEAYAALLLLDDLARLGGGPREAPHVAEGHALRAEGAAGGVQILHRELERDLELVVLWDAVRVLFRLVAVGIHVVPDEVPHPRKRSVIQITFSCR